MGEESKKKGSNKKKVIIAIAALLVVGYLYSCATGGNKTEKKKDESETILDVTGQNVKDAKKALSDTGFTNIEVTADKTGVSSIVLDESNWTVTEQSPKAGEKGNKSDKITLTCKKADEIEQEKVDKAKEQFDKFVDGSVYDAMAKVSEEGYTATYTDNQSNMDFTEEFKSYGKEQLDGWVVVSVTDVDINGKKVSFSVETLENIAANEAATAMEEKLTAKLDPGAAWVAAEQYGGSQYPYGFELHYILDQQAETPEDENTWFLKASCSVTNGYGATAKMTCEAKVTGTSDAPQVVEFYVY